MKNGLNTCIIQSKTQSYVCYVPEVLMKKPKLNISLFSSMMLITTDSQTYYHKIIS